jgi:hypothetical protein
VVQNRKFEAMSDMAARQAALDAAEANGTRVKPEYGSVWYDMNGPDQAHARIHVTIAVPGATSQSTGLADNPKQGGVWVFFLQWARNTAISRDGRKFSVSLATPFATLSSRQQ